jgi:hypothetical protein
METDRFDEITRRYARLLPRRAIAGALGLGALAFPGLSDARKRHKHRRKHKKKVKRNDFGCVDVGKFCKNNGQCCSGRCRGKKDKQTCQAHDTGNCPAGVQELFCKGAGADVSCKTSDGTDGLCDTTTGNAPYCTRNGDCFRCTRDADCVPFCGPQAACIVCPDCAVMNGTQTACVSSNAAGCSFTPQRGTAAPHFS